MNKTNFIARKDYFRDDETVNLQLFSAGDFLFHNSCFRCVTFLKLTAHIFFFLFTLFYFILFFSNSIFLDDFSARWMGQRLAHPSYRFIFIHFFPFANVFSGRGNIGHIYLMQLILTPNAGIPELILYQYLCVYT